ncbi:BPI fold-containing family A member 2-like [Onychomys torridus]|uniref:BPI fold-containing family A member 2-like n=1 Tax=Onychomys torridus TaxID=38674 RepID=UPI00167FB436|nr:BPI fold-containing family A member 2-like [Onychomys torridus]
MTIQMLRSKMFQFGSLVVFCSFLSGTSESHFGSIGSNNLYNLNSISEEVLKNLKSEYLLNWTMPKWPADDRTQLGALNIPNVDRSNFYSPKSDVRPLIGPTANISVSLDILSSLTVQTDAQTRLPTLAIGKCSSDAENITISLFNSWINVPRASEDVNITSTSTGRQLKN